MWNRRREGDTQNEAPNTGTDTGVALQHLVAVLAQIHSIGMIFEPLLGPILGDEESNDQFRSPYVPFSTSTQLAKMKAMVSENLKYWKETYLDPNTRELVVLYHFCEMYLAFPSLQTLISLSGYAPRSKVQAASETSAAVSRVARDVARSRTALDHAWEILDSVSACTTSAETLIWTPVVLFCASLVVWAHISMDDDGALHGFLRVIGFFQLELSRLNVLCSGEMSLVLDQLKKRRLNATSPPIRRNG